MADEMTIEGFKKVHVRTLKKGDRIALKTLVKLGYPQAKAGPTVTRGMAEFEVTEDVVRDSADRGWTLKAKAVTGATTTSRVCGETDHVLRRVS